MVNYCNINFSKHDANIIYNDHNHDGTTSFNINYNDKINTNDHYEDTSLICDANEQINIDDYGNMNVNNGNNKL